MVDMTPKFSGEPTAQALANGLATLGRYGDNYMVHAAEGETVVPGQILDANPQLREILFTQMKAMGIEDPNRYVVGSDLNSINPVTGQPEFFFKKIFKAIKGVAKKVAPIAVPIIGNIIAPGIGGPLASALFTKATGGSFGDALKAGALSFGTQALGRGIGALSAGKDFFPAVQQGVMEPFQAASNLFSSGPANPLSQGIFGEGFRANAGLNMDTFFPKYDPNASGVGALTRANTSFVDNVAGDAGENLGIGRKPPNPAASIYADPNVKGGAQRYLRDLADFQQAQQVPIAQTGGDAGESDFGFDSTVTSGGGSSSGIGQKIKDTLTSKEFLGPALAGAIPAIATYALTPKQEELTPDQLQQLTDPQRVAYNKYRALTPEEKKSGAGQALLQQSGITSFYTPEQLARIAGITPEQAEAFQASKFGVASAAAGGEIIGPGSGTSDSIPAMLSDGEFVMTAEAVRNAGGGDRNLGAARMYDTMNRLERAV